MSASLVGSEMCIRDSPPRLRGDPTHWVAVQHPGKCVLGVVSKQGYTRVASGVPLHELRGRACVVACAALVPTCMRGSSYEC
eukprot:6208877-Alexandrium_andersonii.AAC.1